jgi:hypothetical protein
MLVFVHAIDKIVSHVCNCWQNVLDGLDAKLSFKV